MAGRLVDSTRNGGSIATGSAGTPPGMPVWEGIELVKMLVCLFIGTSGSGKRQLARCVRCVWENM